MNRIRRKITLQDLKDMPTGHVFGVGEAMDNEDGLFMANTGEMLKWVAVRGEGRADWAIYCHFSNCSETFIKIHGDKVTSDANIRKCVACHPEALAEYRK